MAILAFNRVEAESAGLLMQARARWRSRRVVVRGEGEGVQGRRSRGTDPGARARYAAIVAYIDRLGDERIRSAHTLLDPIDGTHQRRFERLEGKKDARRFTIAHDPRPRGGCRGCRAGGSTRSRSQSVHPG